MRARLLVALILGLAVLGCDRETDPKPANPPPKPNPVPVPQADAAMTASASQPNIAPNPATTKRGPETPAVGSVAQPPRKPGGDANPAVTTPGGTGLGPGSPGTR